MKETEESLSEVAKEPTFGESLDLKNIFRIKGQSGLYISISDVNNSGIVGMREFMGDKKIAVHISSLQRLSDFSFNKSDGTLLSMVNVLDNLNANTDSEIQEISIEKLMSIMVPEWDPEKFKPYHAKKVLGWYSEIKSKIQKAAA